MLPIIHKISHVQGRAAKKPGCFRSCVHKTHVLACRIRAQGRYIVGKEELALRGPSLSLLAAGERDRNGLVGPFEMFWCLFKWEGVRSVVGGKRVELFISDTSIQRSHNRPLSSGETRRAAGLFRDLAVLNRCADMASRLRAGAKLIELLAMWAEPTDPAAGHAELGIPIIQRYRDLIEQYAFDPNVSLEVLAGRLGYTMDHLGVLFQKKMGMTAVEFRTQLKLVRASELLVSSPLRVVEIARETGFVSASYFARLFKGKYGISPRQYSRVQSKVILKN